ncbi:hypothetical protein SAMN02745823_02931 [Sporobacter termitidis DSM 10068]|uniref:Uncharacterized protein n=1 Tax=Sporobacter termitidis DSM 10068 TaxID=1123282 RepID=A0A1M5YWL1_9FIRM|nr:hypothetical protein [Sporobacter termitidis]SHI16446.1 hypothetical protein SAMN02745823_02931 [Sporobacter termitidis DSM 10068]
MIKIEIELKDIDYDSLIEQFLPVMTERLRQSDNPVAMLLSNGMPASMAKMILKKLPPATKDQLTADLINTNKDQVVQLLKEAAQSQNIRLEISDLSAKTEN